MRQASLKPRRRGSAESGAGSSERLRKSPVLLTALSCGPSIPARGPMLGPPLPCTRGAYRRGQSVTTLPSVSHLSTTLHQRLLRQHRSTIRRHAARLTLVRPAAGGAPSPPSCGSTETASMAAFRWALPSRRRLRRHQTTIASSDSRTTATGAANRTPHPLKCSQTSWQLCGRWRATMWCISGGTSGLQCGLQSAAIWTT